MIEIFEPRYHDMTILVHVKRIKPNKNAPIMITKGAYAGKYVAPWDVIKECKTEHKPYGDMLIIPLDKLVKVGEDD